MKQAILILLHRDYSQAEKLIKYFNGACDIFIHIDKSCSISKDEEVKLYNLQGVKYVKRRYKVNWAGYSILQAEIFLLKQALSMGQNYYFHLISGQDYPIRPLNDFLSFFSHTSKSGFINCNHLPCDITDGATYYRLQYYVLSDYINTRSEQGKQKVWNIVNWQKKHSIKRRIPDYFDHLYGGSAWFSINRELASFLITYTEKKPQFYRRMRFTYIPEEIYVPTVILNSPYKDNVIWKNNCRTILWNYEGVDYSPINIQDKDFKRLLTNPIGFFSRKFDVCSSQSVIKKIDKYLLQNYSYTVNENGGWINKGINGYTYDNGLLTGIINFSRNYKLNSVCDMGCGPGWYVANLRAKGISAIGYDINPYTYELSSLMEGYEGSCSCGIIDLTEPIKINKRYDLVLCIAVGHYIPNNKEKTFTNNLVALTAKYLVVVWSDEDKITEEYKNPHNFKDVIDLFCSKGNMFYNEVATTLLRKQCVYEINKRHLIVFQRLNFKE